MEEVELSEDLQEKFVAELENIEVEDTDKFVMKELLRSKGKDIHFKTELQAHQINAIVRLIMADNIIKEYDKYVMDEQKDFKKGQSVIKDMTSLYMELLVSKERKGRAEFIDAWKGRLQEGASSMIARFTGQGKEI